MAYKKKETKNFISQEPWTKDVSDSVFQKGNSKDPMKSWLPRRPSEWPTAHVKINECDY